MPFRDLENKVYYIESLKQQYQEPIQLINNGEEISPEIKTELRSICIHFPEIHMMVNETGRKILKGEEEIIFNTANRLPI